MNSVLLQLEMQAEVYKRALPRKNELLKRQLDLLAKPKVVQNVYKSVGLWCMEDYEFYGDPYVFYKTLQIENMCMIYSILHKKHIAPLDHRSLNFYSSISEIPVVVFGLDYFLFELKKPFDRLFFEKLLNHQCDIRSFGNDYVRCIGGNLYATYKFFELFIHFKKKQPCKKLK